MEKRKWFSLLTFCVLCLKVGTFPSRAQNHSYQPMITEGKEWICCDSWQRVTCSYSVDGDTLIEGETYKKIYRTENYGKVSQNTSYYAAMIDRDERVWMYPSDQDTSFVSYIEQRPLILYDFSNECESVTTCYVMSKEGVVNKEVYYMTTDYMHGLYQNGDFVSRVFSSNARFQDQLIDSSHNLCYSVEGIGRNRDPMFVLGLGGPVDGVYLLREELYQCLDKGVCLYDINTGVRSKMISDDVVSVEKLITDSMMSGNPETLYDLTGRRLLHEPEKGMYIKDGRKYLKQ